MRRFVVALTVLAASALAGGFAIAQSSRDAGNGELAADALAVEAERASGQPGDKTPPCPTEEVVDQLKHAGISFGPCVPIPEDFSAQERASLLADAPIVGEPGKTDAEGPGPEDGTEGAICEAVSARTSDGEIDAEIPCGAEVTDEEYVKRDGQTCLKVTSVDKGKALKTPATNVFCTD